MRERTLPQRLVIQFLVAIAIALVVATIGPFGTYNEFTLADRYLYWIIIVPLNWAQIALAIMLISQIEAVERWPRPVIVAIACLVASVPASYQVLWLEQWLRPSHIGEITAWFLWPYVLLLSLVIALPLKKYMWYKAPASEMPAEPVGPATPPQASESPRFLGRVPDHLGKGLLCIEAEDHYLRIHTAAGSDLILYRMTDALSELNGADGLQVHRSFWVAGDAVTGVERNGKRVSLKLANGLVVPVSRTFLPAVREAGWLDRQAGSSAVQSH